MNDRLDDEKEVACLDDTTPADMEVGAGEKMTIMINLIMKKRQHAQMTILLMI